MKTTTIRFALVAAGLAGFAGVAAAQTTAPAPGAGGPGGGLMALDTNRDGSITRAEAEAQRVQMFARTDADRDGFITQAEREAARQAMQASRPNTTPPAARTGGGQGGGMMMQADTNNDGRISRQEFMSQPYRMFDRLDADHNGTITAAEISAARAARAAN